MNHGYCILFLYINIQILPWDQTDKNQNPPSLKIYYGEIILKNHVSLLQETTVAFIFNNSLQQLKVLYIYKVQGEP